MAGQQVTLVYIEIKSEAGCSGDAQQEGMAYLLQDCASEKFHVFMADPQTSSADHGEEVTMQIKCCLTWHVRPSFTSGVGCQEQFPV